MLLVYTPGIYSIFRSEGLGGIFQIRTQIHLHFFAPPPAIRPFGLRHSKIYKITRCAMCHKQIGCSTTQSYSIASYSKQSSEIRNSCIPLCFLEYFYHWRYVVKKVWYKNFCSHFWSSFALTVWKKCDLKVFRNVELGRFFWILKISENWGYQDQKLLLSCLYQQRTFIAAAPTFLRCRQNWKKIITPYLQNRKLLLHKFCSSMPFFTS